MSEAAAEAAETFPRRENAFVGLFRIPVFRRIWAVIAFSSLGDWLGLLANTALAQQLTREQSVGIQGVAISGVILVRLAPDLVFGAFAAAIADKWDRRKTVIVGEVTAGVLYASIALGYNLIWLYVAQFVIEAAGLFTQPAKQVIWVAIVPKRFLSTANQISLMSVYGTVPIASGLFALLNAAVRLAVGPTRVGEENLAIVIALLLNTVTFFVSAATVFLSRRHIKVVPSPREHGERILALLREGVSFIGGNALIRALYVGVIGAFAAGGLTVGVAQLWVATLDAGAAGYSIMFGTVFTGLAVGMLVGPRVFPSYSRSRVFGLAIGSAGVTLLVMSLIRNFILADGLASLVGMFAGMAWVIGYTMIGHEVEDRLRGRIFAFVLSSVRIILLVSIAAAGQLAGLIGSHRLKVGDNAYLSFSGPGLTLLIGGVLALGVSWYATSRATPSRTRYRDLVRRSLLGTSAGPRDQHRGVLVCVDGADPDATAGWAHLVADAIAARNHVVLATGEPTDSDTGRRVAELLHAPAAQRVEPETAALLSAADRAEHVATVVRPALQRGEAVVCNRFVLTSLAIDGAGRGASTDRIRSVNRWSTGYLRPDLTLVVDGPVPAELATAADLDTEAVSRALLDEADADPDRYLLCPVQVPEELPADVLARLERLLRTRSSLLVLVPDAVEVPDTAADQGTEQAAVQPAEQAGVPDVTTR